MATRVPTSSRVLWTGFAGSLLVLAGSLGIGPLTRSPYSLFAPPVALVPFRVPTASVLACMCACVVGAVLLTRAWICLGRRTVPDGAGSQRPRMRFIRRCTWLWSVPLFFALPVFSRDVYSYLVQGRLFGIGADPYQDPVSQLPGWFSEGSDALWAESASPYGPLFLMLAKGVYAWTETAPEVGLLIFRALGLAGMALVFHCLPRLARARGADPVWATWIVVPNPLWLLSMVVGAHNDVLMIALLLLGFVCCDAVRRRSAALVPDAASSGRVWLVLAALSAVALSIAVKPISVLALPFIGLALVGPQATWGKRFGAWTLTGIVVAAELALLGALSGLWFGWIEAVIGQGGAADPYAPWGLLGLGVKAVVTLFAGPDAGTGVREVIYLAGRVISVLVAFWLALRRPRMDAVLACAVTLAASFLLSTNIQPWYWLWVLPLLATWRSFYGLGERLVMIAAPVICVCYLVLYAQVPEWIPRWSVVTVGLVVGLGTLLGMLRLDPVIKPTFGASWWRGPHRIGRSSVLQIDT